MKNLHKGEQPSSGDPRALMPDAIVKSVQLEPNEINLERGDKNSQYINKVVRNL